MTATSAPVDADDRSSSTTIVDDRRSISSPPTTLRAPARRPTVRRWQTWVPHAAALAIALGVLLRLGSWSDLWLDEALSLNIAALPLSDIGDALRQDGAPPLYYVLLHLWTGIFGDGAVAARSLSALFSLGALPLMWLAGRRIGGRATAWIAVVLLASSPFAVRYATEARMYALVQLLVVAGYLTLHRALERPTRIRLTAVALVAGLLPLTHYWTLFLLAGTAATLVALRRRDDTRGAAGACLVAMAVGMSLFVPWAPSFLFQVTHTGNPWDPPAELVRGLFTAFLYFGGSVPVVKTVLAASLAVMVVAAIGPRLRDRLAGTPSGWHGAGTIEATVGLAVLSVGLLVSGVIGAAFAARYASAVFPLLVLGAAAGARSIRPSSLRYGILAVAVVAGLTGSVRNVAHPRTQAGEVASAIMARAEPGDVVAYCPDQLGPAVSRHLPDWLTQMTYPHGGSPDRVNWVDYAERNREAEPAVFARFVDAVAGPRHDVFLVWREGYRTLGGGCERTATALRLMRPGATVVVTPTTGASESHYVTRLPGS